MKKMLHYMARYDFAINMMMMDRVMSMKEEERTGKIGNKYGSILGIVNHLLEIDVMHLQMMEVLTNSEIIRESQFSRKNYRGFDINNLSEVKDTFRGAFLVLLKFFEDIDESELLRFTDRFNNHVWKLNFHMLNHGTHHRGSIHEAMHSMGYYEDWSGAWQNQQFIESNYKKGL